MEIICISTFNGIYKIRGISISRKYNAKLYHQDYILIENDFGRLQMVNCQNFLKYNKYINYEK